jgi:D-alanyl-D-alanine endopeptidase (penicillin-binding protein 7)
MAPVRIGLVLAGVALLVVGLAHMPPRVSRGDAVAPAAVAATAAVAPSPPPPPPVALDPAGNAVWERLFRAEEATIPAPDWPLTVSAAAPPDPPRLRSKGYYVVDAGSGELLAAQAPGAALPIASLTKLMAAMIWADSGADPEAVLDLTQADKDFVQVTRSRLRVGARYRAWDLLHSSLLSSDNRATVALMRQSGLPREAFAAAMERRAAAMGLDTATFGDPTGLDPRDAASPRDVARLLWAAMQHEVIGPILGLEEYRYQRADRPVWLAARSSNRLAHMDHWEVSGSKTGYTELAGSCLVFRTTIANRDLVITLLGARGLHSRYGDAARLRAWLEAAGPAPDGVDDPELLAEPEGDAEPEVDEVGEGG